MRAQNSGSFNRQDSFKDYYQTAANLLYVMVTCLSLWQNLDAIVHWICLAIRRMHLCIRNLGKQMGLMYYSSTKTKTNIWIGLEEVRTTFQVGIPWLRLLLFQCSQVGLQWGIHICWGEGGWFFSLRPSSTFSESNYVVIPVKGSNAVK